MSIFLTQISTRHSFLTKSKTLVDNKSGTTRKRGKHAGAKAYPVEIREESDDEDVSITTDQIAAEEDALGEDDKKRLGFKTRYEGFSIWGWVLCLLVTRKGGPSRKGTESTAGQALMEEWIYSTQQQQEEGEG